MDRVTLTTSGASKHFDMIHLEVWRVSWCLFLVAVSISFLSDRFSLNFILMFFSYIIVLIHFIFVISYLSKKNCCINKWLQSFLISPLIRLIDQYFCISSGSNDSCDDSSLWVKLKVQILWFQLLICEYFLVSFVSVTVNWRSLSTSLEKTVL